MDFAHGDLRVLITKPSICGFGMNFQSCHNVIFLGLSDSYEQFYQAVRRCQRFGQKRQVHVHIFTAENEGQILANLKRKEKQHNEMSANMIEHMRDIMNNELAGQVKVTEEYREDVHHGEGFTVHLSDCVKLARTLPDNSIDYSVFSPPFADLYAYSDDNRDLGNSTSYGQFFEHFAFTIFDFYFGFSGN
mgnify:CR=1 FL=1